MNNRERFHAVMNYMPYDRMPIVHFDYWPETLDRWRTEGHISSEERNDCYDGSLHESIVSSKLGFDFNYNVTYKDRTGEGSMFPVFEEKIIETRLDGTQVLLNNDGAMVIRKQGICSIPAEVGHLLVDRKSWEEHYLPKFQYSEDRFYDNKLMQILLQDATRDYPLGLHCKSILGQVRSWLGIVNLSYLYVDDEDLFREIINTVGDLSYRLTERVLRFGMAPTEENPVFRRFVLKLVDDD